MSAPLETGGEQKITEPLKPSNRVYCRWEVTDDVLKELFSKMGKVTEARVIRGPRLHAFGFVTFETEAEATQAIAALNGKTLQSPITVEYAAPERPRKPRAPRQPAAVDAAAPAPAMGAPAMGAPAPASKPRARRGPKAPQQPQAQGTQPQDQQAPQKPAPVAGAEGRPRRRRPRRVQGSKDPNWGKVVSLFPDPIRTPITPDAKMAELNAGPRQYRAGVTAGKVISSLILNADPTKGPFNCDFRLGDFDLKLLSVKVNSKPGIDCRISARILQVATQRSREAYLRVRPATPAENRHKFLEMVKAGTDESQQHEAFFVAIDSIQLDVTTGLWKKIVLSLVSAIVPPRPPREAMEPVAAAPVNTTTPQ